MKKIGLLTLGIVALLSSCSKETVSPSTEGLATSYTFTSAINMATRATDAGFESGDQIGVSAYTDAGLTSQAASNVLYSYDGTKFVSDTPIEYSAASDLAFRAVYPYDGSLSDSFTFDIAKDQTSYADYTTSDLMVSQTTLTDESEPELTFNHMLSSIVVSVSSNTTIYSSSVAINSMLSVSCDLNASTFVGTGATSTIVAYGDATSSMAIVAPQSVAAGTEFIVVTINDVDYSVVLNEDITLLSGKQYTYTGVITATGELEFTSEINAWGDGGEISGSTAGSDEPADEDPFEITVDELTPYSAIVTVTPSSSIPYYFAKAIPAATLETYYDGDMYSYITGEADYYLGMANIDVLASAGMAYAGAQTINFSSICGTLKPETEYQFAVIGVAADNSLLDYEALTITTPAEEVEEEGFVATISISDITTSSAYISWTVNDESAEYVYGLFTSSGLLSYTNDEIMEAVVSTYNSYGVLSSYTYTGNAGGTFTSLSSNTDYSMFIFTIDADGVPSSTLSRADFTTAEAISSDEYDAWLGTWDLTSTSSTISGTPVTVSIIIDEDIAGDTYSVYGWDLSTYRMSYAMPATFDSTTNGWTVAAENYIGSSTSGDIYYKSVCYVEAPYSDFYFVSGSYNALAATFGSDATNASVACTTSSISDGTLFTVASMIFTLVDGSSTYTFYSDTTLGVDENDWLVGPFTMTKTSDSTTLPSSAPAANATYTSFDVESRVAAQSVKAATLNTKVQTLVR